MGPVGRGTAKSDPDKLRGLIDNINKAVNGGGILGFKLDPRANPLPNESVPSYMGRRIGESLAGAAQPIKEAVSSVAPVVKQFTSGLMGEQPAVATTASSPTTVPKPTLPPGMQSAATYTENLRPATITATRPEGTATMRRFTGEAIPGQTMADRASPENLYGADVVGLARPGAKQGAWVGAATDEEAARNLQDRVLQDQATQAEVARLNRATDALRSLREARSPAFSFGVDSIGGGPDKLDVASGRVINRDTPAGVVADRMASAVQTARRFGTGGKSGKEIAKQMGDAYMADKGLQGIEAQLSAKQGTGINPVDMGRFLLDQQKFAQQQGIDKSNLQLREKELQNKEAGTSLEQQKYLDTQRKAFTDNFTFSDQNAPREQIGADVFEMSRVSGIPPETVAATYEQVVKESGIDWGKGGPKNQKALSEEVMKRLARDYRG